MGPLGTGALSVGATKAAFGGATIGRAFDFGASTMVKGFKLVMAAGTEVDVAFGISVIAKGLNAKLVVATLEPKGSPLPVAH